MRHMLTAEDSPDEKCEANASFGEGYSKNIPVNENDEAEVSKVLSQIEQKTREAVDVIMKVSEKSSKKLLFPEIDQLLHIQCVYKKPGTTYNGHRGKLIILPHPLHEKGNTTICLIMRDLDHSAKAKRDPDVDKQARQWAEMLENQFGVTREHVQKILTKRQLEREYRSYFQKRQLASAYDIFLVDIAVEKSVARFCGKEFHVAKKTPLRLYMRSHKSLIKEIEKAYYTVIFPVSPLRSRVSIRVGNLSNPIAHIVENVRTAVENIFRYCPGGLVNIRSLNLQMVTGGPSLPLYLNAGPVNAVHLPQPLKKKELITRRNKKAIVDELSTLPEGLEVMVHKDGAVKVVDSETKKPIFYSTVNAEKKEGDEIRPKINLKEKEKIAEKRRKLREKRKKQRAKNKLLPEVKNGIISIKGLLRKAKGDKSSHIRVKKRNMKRKGSANSSFDPQRKVFARKEEKIKKNEVNAAA